MQRTVIMQSQQTDAASVIAKQHHLLAQRINGWGEIAQLAARTDDQPMTSKPDAGRRTAAYGG